MKFTRLNPVTGEIASEADAMQPAEMAAVAAKAQLGFEAWSKVGPNARRAVLQKAATALESKQEAFVAAMMGETGATAGWAMFNLMLAASMLREASALTTQISGEVIPSDKPGCMAMALREPVGVILGIAPWNAPIILGTRAVSTALACGNAVILKASEICPQTHSLIIEALAEAGFPEGTVNIVTNSLDDAADVVGALIDAKEVKRINFTGSTNVGRIIARRAADNLKPCLLELGGKAPLLVLEDANLEETVKAAAFGAYMNQGQICMSTERLVVVDAIADEFVAAFKQKVSGMETGDPREGTTPLGAVIDMKTVEKVNALIDDAVSKGATIVTGGKADSVLMPATILDGVTKDMAIYADESFGPVVAVIRAKDEADAIRIANDSEYGLSAAVFTTDIANGLKVAKQIKSGICHVNGPTVHDEAQMPFGGVGASGYGRFGGKAGIDQFTELRWITVETEPGHYPI
ncbi:aldehyde dehydrogenase [Alteromonas lipolytica]|uniref:Aldehyde dehydrogenase n=1 Tax=Alteromonas lipolytica TaxID=1856405 RepID=A0A1E8FJJ8_9ALTE|nr:aldehyde dehydrogenase [Alteromonas lipolytica]OFI35926.1 salicylaldehyde dehydrogenase [Alteromonas lipolytica]GGF72530.1 aldehyde dehydrogenase [Alteromonas lipolytica]